MPAQIAVATVAEAIVAAKAHCKCNLPIQRDRLELLPDLGQTFAPIVQSAVKFCHHFDAAILLMLTRTLHGFTATQ
jgi:hypothetical protein